MFPAMVGAVQFISQKLVPEQLKQDCTSPQAWPPTETVHAMSEVTGTPLRVAFTVMFILWLAFTGRLGIVSLGGAVSRVRFITFRFTEAFRFAGNAPLRFAIETLANQYPGLSA